MTRRTRERAARAPQSPFGDKAMPKIRAAAKKFGDQSERRPVAGMDDTERRYTPGVVEVRTAQDGQRIVGYGAVFGKLSRNLGGFVEGVGDGAFNQSRADGWPNVVCRYNHDPNMLLGTTAGGTLQLRTDNVGLDYDVLPPQSRADILELVRARRHPVLLVRVPGAARAATSGASRTRTTRCGPCTRWSWSTSPRSWTRPTRTPRLGCGRSPRRWKPPFEDVADMAQADELRRFFIRTDRPSHRGAAEAEDASGAAAMCS